MLLRSIRAACFALCMPLVTACAGHIVPTPSTTLRPASQIAHASAQAKNVHPDAAYFHQAGPKLNTYAFNYDGFTDPTNGGGQTDAAAFNSQAAVAGAAVPPSTALMGSASTFGGSPGKPVDLQVTPTTSLGVDGLSYWNCSGLFMYPSSSGTCTAAASSTSSAIKMYGFVQSWPIYVDTAGSSQFNPGQYSFESTTDDGAFLMVGPKAFTYAQPGNFAGASGLTRGVAVIHNEDLYGPFSATGSFTISNAMAKCSSNVYWITWEYFEALGGGAEIEYSGTAPDGTRLTQGAVYGQVTRGGIPVAGDTISVSGAATGTLQTDATGCYGWNIAKAGSYQITVTDNGVQQALSATVGYGHAKQLNFAF